MRLQLGLLLVLAAGLVPWRATPARAQAFGSDGISVSGSGEMAIRPNLVELDLNITGRAELTGDALVKYRDTKKRLTETLDKLGLKDLATEERGLMIYAGLSPQQQQRVMNGQPQGPGKSQISVSSTIRVRLSNVRDLPPEELIKTVGRLIDVIQDAGISLGLSQEDMQMRQQYGVYAQGGASIRFVATDVEQAREKAYELAVADARARGDRLAKLHGLKLGSALSVQELQVAGDTGFINGGMQGYSQMAFMNGLLDADAVDRPQISSMSLASIPVQVKLQVRFAIDPSRPATAQK